MAVIWYLSSSADTPGPPLAHPLDWIAHFLAYLALGFSLGRATGRPGLALVIAVWWGALDEVHQAFVPGRDAGVQDWLFDLAGASLGVWRAGRVGSGDRVSRAPAAQESGGVRPDVGVRNVAVLSERPR
ncbi:antibiotic resistance protein VanZ [Deinococcus koreensis]|uniref:Antibiotic resistance protein VanZ n=2 Tax=Deinococcus koreensis TaxID=2054903 RepID=A0A2K3V238_9DEIO|nr:VanZ family protein [Deinococcus koreensis]PNY82844.1 antibiotic resistance protein VanZ [Deinococcus koreensis]